MIAQSSTRSSTHHPPGQMARAKPFTLHCSLLLIVFCYAFFGGLVFRRLETDALKQHRKDLFKAHVICVEKLLLPSNMSIYDTAKQAAKCWASERDERSEWGFMTATLYGFGIITTLGYNRLAPITTIGRLFCMLYGIVGIPLTMIIIANVGQYLRKYAVSCRKRVHGYWTHRNRKSSQVDQAPDNVTDADDPVEYGSLSLLLVFCAYIAFGAWLFPFLNGQSDFINGLYYNFLCLTAMDFGQLAPQRVAFLPITFVYVCFGLAITTIAIETGSEYMRKLHYIGQRVKNVANTKIWFNGKTLKVRDLLLAVGKKCGVDPKIIDSLDLENVVEISLAIKEGREPPADRNDDFLPQEPRPKPPPLANLDECQEIHPSFRDDHSKYGGGLHLKNAMIADMTSLHSCSSFEPSLRGHNIIPIAATPVDDRAYLWEAPFIAARPKETIVPIEELPKLELQPEVVAHVDRTKPVITVSPESHKDDIKGHLRPRARSLSPVHVPLKFEEKIEMFGRDKNKLLQTYQAEWKRLRIDERHGRRGSYTTAPSRSSSPWPSTKAPDNSQ